ncbi:uncharacterized protein LOC110848770 [Folsomia candida]|uniref:uncharacterized protein LOC110848770 n=1 Tax=Folsomia candida TaxID=158441 RepID=UPI000B8F0339|nr:uncharacterized protein LOC110848770 [Folsomia candida]
MCFFCCATLRGATYFMVTVHMVATFVISLISVNLFLNPPNYPDINLSPLIMSQLPLIVASYCLLASLFACFIFRAIDTDSVTQLKWSVLCFAVYQSLVLSVQLIFSVMFGDIVTKAGQNVIAGIFLVNFFMTVVYLMVLFLYGRHLHQLKTGSNQGIKLYRNALPIPENNWKLSHLPASLYLKDVHIPDLNLLQNHPAVTRSNSVAAVSMTISIGTNTADFLTQERIQENSENARLEEAEEEVGTA